MERRDFLFAAGAAAVGGVVLGAAQEGDSPTHTYWRECPDGECPQQPECGPDGCPVNLVRAPQPAYGLESVQAYTGVVLDLPPELRTKNWGGGSCVHASNVTLLKWMGQFEMAEWWRNNYSGGENDSRLISRMEAAGLKYCWSSDPSFFDWCTRTRRGAGIFYKPSHSINFVGKTYPWEKNPVLFGGHAYLLDNNATGYPESHGFYETVPWNDFVQRWRGYGAFAWSLIYDPPAGGPVN